MNTPLQKRFWEKVSVRPDGDGFAIYLDERQLKTPAKASLVVPTKAMAEGIAAEWDAVEGKINPLAMHLTRCANATIDKVVFEREAVAAMLLEYASTDLVCYRSESPEELVARQTAAWDPVLDWLDAEFGARLHPVAGIIHKPQPEASLARLKDAVFAFDPWKMTAFHDLVTISGSLVLSLAVTSGHMSAQEVWPLSRVDEDWQIEQWGEDDEATEHAALKLSDFLKAARLFELLNHQN